MQGRLTRTMLMAAVAIVYALVALSLPCLLLDHAFAMQAGDEHHSGHDVHAWLEWAAGSSLADPPSPSLPSLAPVPASPVPSVVVRAVLPGLAHSLRGPPALA
ncbi:MAG: hypothetical protein NNA31_04015 [Nitrospira sp.]|nr:hypothetical protein [Nitrospira sp.]